MPLPKGDIEIVSPVLSDGGYRPARGGHCFKLLYSLFACLQADRAHDRNRRGKSNSVIPGIRIAMAGLVFWNLSTIGDGRSASTVHRPNLETGVGPELPRRNDPTVVTRKIERGNERKLCAIPDAACCGRRWPFRRY